MHDEGIFCNKNLNNLRPKLKKKTISVKKRQEKIFEYFPRPIIYKFQLIDVIPAIDTDIYYVTCFIS